MYLHVQFENSELFLIIYNPLNNVRTRTIRRLYTFLHIHDIALQRYTIVISLWSARHRKHMSSIHDIGI
jgi:hypothetical protein